MSLPLSGPVADRAKPGMEGYQYWVDELNANGGLLGRQVELKVLDDGFDQQTAISDYNRLISQDKVDLVLGTFSSDLNVAVAPVAERLQVRLHRAVRWRRRDLRARLRVPVLRSARHHPEAAEPVRRPDRGDARGRASPDPGARADRRPEHLARPPSSSRSASVSSGVKTVYDETYAPDTSNFDTIANAIKQADPDLVISGAVGGDGAALVLSFQKVGFSPGDALPARTPRPTRPTPTPIGEANTEGIFTALAYSAEATYADNADFVAGLHRGVRRRAERGRCQLLHRGPGPGRRPSRPSASWTSLRLPSGCTRTRSTRSSARSAGTRPAAHRARCCSASSRTARFASSPRRRRRPLRTSSTSSPPGSEPTVPSPAAPPSKEGIVTLLVQTLILGLLVGGVYALMSSGFTLVFGVMKMINLAHAAMIVLRGLPDLVDLGPDRHRPAGRRCAHHARHVRASGGCSTRALIARVQHIDHELAMVASFGVAVAAGGVMSLIWGTESRIATPSYFNSSFQLGPLVDSAGAALRVRRGHRDAAVCSSPLLRATSVGRAIRACATNRDSAAARGQSTSSARWRRCSRSAPRPPGSGGRPLSVLYQFVPDSHYVWIGRILCVVILGGLGSFVGAALGWRRPRSRRGTHGDVHRHPVGDRRAIRPDHRHPAVPAPGAAGRLGPASMRQLDMTRRRRSAVSAERLRTRARSWSRGSSSSACHPVPDSELLHPQRADPDVRGGRPRHPDGTSWPATPATSASVTAPSSGSAPTPPGSWPPGGRSPRSWWHRWAASQPPLVACPARRWPRGEPGAQPS